MVGPYSNHDRVVRNFAKHWEARDLVKHSQMKEELRNETLHDQTGRPCAKLKACEYYICTCTVKRIKCTPKNSTGVTQLMPARADDSRTC